MPTYKIEFRVTITLEFTGAHAPVTEHFTVTATTESRALVVALRTMRQRHPRRKAAGLSLHVERIPRKPRKNRVSETNPPTTDPRPRR